MVRAFALLVLAVGAGVAASPGHTISERGPTLVVSVNADRSNASSLAGKTVYGRIHVFLRGVTAARVRFYLDDPSLQGSPRHVAVRAPFDFAGSKSDGDARPFDTAPLADGRHTIAAVIRYASGRSVVLRTSFSVQRWFVSPTGSDAARCSRSSPCQSFARAFTVAPAGAVVEVRSGWYGCPDIRGTKSSDVAFVAARGAVVSTTCELPVDATHIAFKNINLDGLRMAQTASYITLHNVNITCKDEAPYTLYGGLCSAGIFGAPSHFAMYGGSVGPTYDNDAEHAPGNSQIGIPYEGGPYEAKQILFDGVRFHDNRLRPGAHSECLMVGGGNGVTIRNSRFDHCAIFDIYFTWWSFTSPQYQPPTNILLENNWFQNPNTQGYYAVRFGEYMTKFVNIAVLYNSSTGLITMGDGPKTNVVFDSNVAPLPSYECTAGITYKHNVWDGARCGTTDRDAPSGFVDPAAFDLRLKRGAAAVDHGDRKSFPRTDIFGHKRPRGRGPDAGASER